MTFKEISEIKYTIKKIRQAENQLEEIFIKNSDDINMSNFTLGQIFELRKARCTLADQISIFLSSLIIKMLDKLKII